MGLLAAVAYEPTTAVTKNTTALLALTAFDTTNLRVTFTVPASGIVFWTARGVIHGATTVPQIRIGMLAGSTVMGTIVPSIDTGNLAATTLVPFVAERPVTGLTPGSTTWDLAYAVETLVASSAIKYGGPNNTTANDSFGAITFSVWDPQ